MYVKQLLDQYKPHGLWYFMPVSAGYGEHGIPDIIACFVGQFIAIECKSPKGHLTALQEMQLTRLAFAGAFTITIKGTDNMDLLQMYLNTLLTKQVHATPPDK
jgi:Holliday junction resolvase